MRRILRRWRGPSPLTLRILAVNVLALAILVAGLLYVGQYERELVSSELEVLRSQGRLLSLALGEGAIPGEQPVEGTTVPQATAEPNSEPRLAPENVRRLIRRLSETTNARMRVFGAAGELIADSHRLHGGGGLIEIEDLPQPDTRSFVERAATGVYDWILNSVPGATYPVYVEQGEQQAMRFQEVMAAIAGVPDESVRLDGYGNIILSVAEPIQYYRKVIGALLVSQDGGAIRATIRNVRLNILAVSLVALFITVLLSIYLAGAIARPIRRLAAAAERVRAGVGRGYTIPDLSRRHDEIGDLSLSLRAMTAALHGRLDAIERFAADVAHELKNPLTSLRSAVETAVRLEDPARQRQLLQVVIDDVRRMDRLITDISAASRLDAELSRAEPDRFDVGRMLATLVEIERMNDAPDQPVFILQVPPQGGLKLQGFEDRLVQVFRNLISNAKSFSPPGGRITVTARRADGDVRIEIEDEGPGIPAGKEEAIFDRFYSERPAGEKFGTHSGLGLSISRQIVTAHGGRIEARNRVREDGTVAGARFTVTLPGDRPD